MVRGKVKSKGANTVYRIRVSLCEIEPAIWRTFAVRGSTTLDVLHGVVQAVMGWTDSHLHEFVIEGKHLLAAAALEVGDFEDLDAEKEEGVVLAEVVPRQGMHFEYEYDFGDGWHHSLEVEEIGPPETGVEYPVCLAGARACPPEDCGGPWGYPELLEVLANPSHEEFESTLEWVGDAFDPERFDLEEVNGLLRAI